MDWALPSVSSSLLSADSQTRHMHENERMCRHVLDRLQRLSDNFQQTTSSRDSSISFQDFVDVVTAFTKFLQKRAEQSFVKRVASTRKVEGILVGFHQDIDLLQPGDGDDWRSRFEEDRQLKLQQVRALMDDKQVLIGEKDSTSFVEGLFMLKFELDHKKEQYGIDAVSRQQLHLIKRALSKLITLSSVRLPAIPDWFIPSDDVDFDASSCFNCGSYGSVHRGIWHSGIPGGKGAKVVVKSLLVDDDAAKKSFYKEVNVWHGLDHPHVLKLYGACHVSSPAFFVCDDATHGSFAEYFEEDRSELWRLFYEAALGLSFLHAHKVVHGDLKCTNLLVGSDYKAKLCDFGFSYIRGQSVGLSAKSQTDAVRWKAPECLAPLYENPDPQFNPRFASDVFSLGMCIIEAFLGEAPYGIQDDEEIMAMLFDGQMHPRPDGMKDDEWALVERLIDPNWETRISLSEAVDALKGFADREEQAKATAADTRECLSCGASMPERFTFCGECGRSMRREASREAAVPAQQKNVCPSCDGCVDVSDRYCRQCGCYLDINPAFA